MTSGPRSGAARQSWVRPAVLLGVWYALTGIVFAVPAIHVQAWRLTAWVVSAYFSRSGSGRS